MKRLQGMRRRHRHDRSESGYTPLQISAGLIIVAGLTALTVSVVKANFVDMGIRTTYVQLQDVIDATEDYISDTHSYLFSTNDVLSQGSIPSSIAPVSGGIVIGYHNVTITGASDHTEVKIQNLSRRACARLLMYDFGSRVAARRANQSQQASPRYPNLPFAEAACTLPETNTITFSLK